MAWRMKLQLPSFKVTQRCTRGNVAQYSIHAYSEWLLQEVIQCYPSRITIYLMYDIACTLIKHLQVS